MIYVQRQNKERTKLRTWGFYLASRTVAPTLVLCEFKEKNIKTGKYSRHWCHNSIQKPSFEIPLPESVKKEAVAEMLNQLQFDILGETQCFTD